MTQAAKGERFRDLHEGEPFIIPNPWDAGSARLLETPSASRRSPHQRGFAFTLGRSDGEVRSTRSPITSGRGCSDRPAGVGRSRERLRRRTRAGRCAVTRVAEAGAVGGSIEDYDPAGEIYGFDHAVDRVRAAVEVARALGFPFMLTARAENHIRGNPDLDDTIARLQAFEAAGADVLYAPGLRSADEIRAVCEAVSKPVNVLALPGMSLSEIVDAGAQRISVGRRPDVGRGQRDGRRGRPSSATRATYRRSRRGFRSANGSAPDASEPLVGALDARGASLLGEPLGGPSA